MDLLDKPVAADASESTPASISPAYDPRAEGCLCDSCPLNGRPVVPPEIRSGARLLIIAEAPGKQEEIEGRPMVGPSGRELERMLAANGHSREDVSISNVLLCRPPRNDMRALLSRTRRENSERKAAGLEPLPTALECCRPRLERELDQAPALLLLGAYSLQLLGEKATDVGLSKARGFPLCRKREWAPAQPSIATYHPAFVLRSRRWTETVRSDVGKAFRHAAGQLEWVAPNINWDPTAAELDEALTYWSRTNAVVAVDTETAPPSGWDRNAALDPEIAVLRCVQLGSADRAIVVWFQSVEEPGRVPACPTEYGRQRVAEFLSRHPRLCSHNGLVYDKPVLDRHGMPLVEWKDRPAIFDTLLAHRVLDSELPHNLDYLMSRFTDAAKHKGGGHSHWASDQELGFYGAMDVCGTARLATPFRQELIDRQLVDAYAVDFDKQRLCRNMHRAGMAIDQAERDRHGVRLTAAMREAEARAKTALPQAEKISLTSTAQLRDLLYDTLGLDLPEVDGKELLTTSGSPSVGKDAIYALLARSLPPHVERFLDALMDYRRAFKFLTAFVTGLPVYPDGRVHPLWATTTVTGRLSAQHPNVQQCPSVKLDTDSMRSMYIAAPGNVLVSIDQEQLELRLVALFARDEIWLEAFANGWDPHKLNTVAFFHTPRSPIVYDPRTGEDSVPKSLRTFAKCVVGSTRVPIIGRGLPRIDRLGMAPIGEHITVDPLPVVGPDGKERLARAFYYGGRQPTFKIRTYTGYELEGTGKHRVILADGSERRLDELQVGDEVAVAPQPEHNIFPTEYKTLRVNPWVSKDGPSARRELNHDAPGLPEVRLDERWGYVIGAVQGDGSLGNSGIGLIGLPEDGVVDHAAALLREMGLVPHVVDIQRKFKRKDGGAVRPLRELKVHAIPFKQALARLGFIEERDGRMRKALRVPDFIFESPRSVVVAYLAGLFDTDGTINVDGVSITSKSRELMHGVKILLDVLGMRSRIAESWNKTYQRHYYTMQLGRRAARVFADQIPLACRRKIEDLRRRLEAWGPGFAYATSDKIVTIETGESEVYDLCVPDGQLFVTQGIISHNTAVYLYVYSGGAKRAMLTLRQVRDPKTGERVYRDLTLKESKIKRQRLLEAHPALPRWWDETLGEFRRAGELRSIIHDRPRKFLDCRFGDDSEESMAEIVNFRVQAGAAAIVDESGRILMDEIGWPWDGRSRGRGLGGPGIIQQGHDAIVVEVAASEAERAKAILEASFRRRVEWRGATMDFHGSAKIGTRWSALE